MAADGSSEAAGQHGSHARLSHVTAKGVPKFATKVKQLLVRCFVIFSEVCV